MPQRLKGAKILKESVFFSHTLSFIISCQATAVGFYGVAFMERLEHRLVKMEG
jgi:hypothetical protein